MSLFRAARRRAGIVAICLVASLSPPIQAAPGTRGGNAWPGPPRAQPTDAAAILALSERFPESAALLRRVIAASLEPGSEARLRSALDRLASMGYALSDGSIQAIGAHLPAVDAAALTARFHGNRRGQGASALGFVIGPRHRLVEGLAWDAPRRRLFASSVVGRELLVHDAQGWRAVPGIDAGSLFGLAIEPRRQLLWLTSGVVDQTPSPDTAFRGLIALDLTTLRVVRRIAAPAGGSPGDIALAADGTAFASDPLSGAVYRAGPGADRLDLLVPPGAMRSPQGLALSPDGRRLYVADYGYGLAAIDLRSRRISRVSARGIAMLDGIDGLIADGATLIAIQNGVSPARILRLHLGAGGLEVARVEILERANSLWGEPTLGTLAGRDLLYVADGQWARYGRGGAVIGEAPIRPTAIRILGLRNSGRPAAGPR